MKKAWVGLIPVVGVLLIGNATSASAADACAALLPRTLRTEFTHDYKGFALPRQSDYGRSDITNNLAQGGSGCLGIAMGSYYPGNDKNFAIIITSKRLNDTLLIVAKSVSDAWKMEVVSNMMGFNFKGLSYVATIGPGKYTAVLGASVLQPGARESYTALREGIEFGAIGSGHAVYFFEEKAWIHVVTSD